MQAYINSLLTIILSVSTSPEANASSEHNFRRLNRIAEAYENLGWFSGSVHVTKQNEVLLSKGYGYANESHEVKNTSLTKFLIASVSKQFTATVILLLEEEGKLSVDDFVSKYIPDYRHAEKIRIHDLLTHSSGIPNTNQLDNLDTNSHYSVPDLFSLFKDKDLEFEPGTRWAYSNTGYYLLGMIIEKASGKPYREFINSKIVEPFALRSTLISSNRDIIQKFANTYTYDSSGRLINAKTYDYSWTFAAGDYVSTVIDLSRWDRLLSEGSILSNNGEQRLFEPYIEVAEGTSYGYGWFLDKFASHRRIWHSGGLPGVATFFYRYPDADSSIIVLANRNNLAASALAQDLSAAILGEPFTLPHHRTAKTPSEDAMNAVTGKYKLTNLGIEFELEIFRTAEGVAAKWMGEEEFAMSSESPELWFVPWDDITWSFDFSGNITSMSMQFGDRVATGEKIQ